MITFGSDDLWSSLSDIGIALVVVAVIVGLVIWRGRRRGSRTIALDAALAISGWWVLLSIVGAVIIVVKALTVDWAEFDGTTFVYLDWPAGLSCSEYGDSGEAMLTCGSETFTDFTVGKASLGLRLLAAAAQLSTQALATIPALILVVICFQTLRGRTFSRTVTRALTGGAVAVLLLGVTSDLLGGIAATTALREVFALASQWYPTRYQLTVTPLPFAGSLALAALAAVFHQGIRLQKEKEDLQRETEGLV